MRLADVKTLGGKKTDAETDDEPEDDDADAEGTVGSPNGKRKAEDSRGSPQEKKPRFVDFGAAMNSAKRTLRATYIATESKYNDVMSKAKAALDGVLTLPPVEQKRYTGEVKLLQTRLEGCQHAAGTSPPELDAYILRFATPDAPAASPPVAGDAVSGAAPAASAPPAEKAADASSTI